jgi:tRNA pseudouridine13 synthase
LFVAEDVEPEQARCDARETVVTGPMFGPKMRTPTGEPARRESAALERSGLSIESFAKFGKIALGTRRPYTIWPRDLEIRQEPEGLRLFFALPAGAYATVVLREFMKAESTD